MTLSLKILKIENIDQCKVMIAGKVGYSCKITYLFMV
jgi:hypothetical protein